MEKTEDPGKTGENNEIVPSGVLLGLADNFSQHLDDRFQGNVICTGCGGYSIAIREWINSQ